MVELCGTVTSLDSYADKFLLTLDDSTDVIPCVLWNTSSSDPRHRKILDANLLSRNQVSLGDLVRIRGKIRLLPNKPLESRVEISIHGIHKETDLNVELMHALEVMTLDKRYREPFKVETSIVKLAKGVASFEEVLRAHLGLSGPLRIGDVQPAPQVGAPRNTLPRFVHPFSVVSLLETDSLASTVQAHADRTQKKPDLIVRERLNALKTSVDVLEDPHGRVINYARECAYRTGIEGHFAHEGSLSYSEEGMPSEQTPFVLWTADLLVPIVYESILLDYYTKQRNGQKDNSLKFWYGARTNKILEAAKSAQTGGALQGLTLAKISLAINILVHLDLVYEVDEAEFRPVTGRLPQAVIDWHGLPDLDQPE